MGLDAWPVPVGESRVRYDWNPYDTTITGNLWDQTSSLNVEETFSTSYDELTLGGFNTTYSLDTMTRFGQVGMVVNDQMLWGNLITITNHQHLTANTISTTRFGMIVYSRYPGVTLNRYSAIADGHTITMPTGGGIVLLWLKVQLIGQEVQRGHQPQRLPNKKRVKGHQSKGVASWLHELQDAFPVSTDRQIILPN